MYFIEERVRRITEELGRLRYSDSERIESFKMKQGDFKGGELQAFDTTDWDNFKPGDRWGGINQHYWFKTEIVIPERFDGKTVVIHVKTGREGQWDATNPQFMIYINDRLTQGMDVNHWETIICESAKAGEQYHVALYAYAGMEKGLLELESCISVLDRDIEKLYFHISVPYGVAMLLNKDDKHRIDILEYLNNAINILDLRKPFFDEFNLSIYKACEYLDSEFYQNYCGSEDATVLCVGHTHIDVAWLWTVAQTREKVVRSFSTAINLMEKYPEFTFMSSQPQLYKYVKEENSVLYEKIKELAAKGRWETDGAMWLEADCNLTTGESLVRQLLFGTRFFNKEFGVKSKILWLPDVFGYSAALPQILKKSGIDYFMTTKISWNDYNKMPYDTFMWRGIDGTEILTHFITARHPDSKFLNDYNTTYVGNITPPYVFGAWQRYQQKHLNTEVLMAYGHGDGGGGPTREMLENARRLEKGIPGCPKVKMGKVLDFFERLEKKVVSNSKLPKWVGELYLEFHRGTYTSMAKNKKYNRKSELLYLDVEFLSAISSIISGSEYPQDTINESWETILLNQFHDILPGSSIKEVYEDSAKDYEGVLIKGQKLVNKAIKDISSKIGLKEKSIVVFNQLDFKRNDIVEVELPKGFDEVEIKDLSGRVLFSQNIDTCNKEGVPLKKVLFYAENIPSKGYKVFTVSKKKDFNSTTVIPANNKFLSNRFFDISFDDSFNICSIFDKLNERDVVKAGRKANVLQTFEDKPKIYDAWEINLYYQEKMWEINDIESAEVVENGPVRACLRIKRRFLNSIIIQNIYIYNDIPRIDFHNVINWKEKQILLKAAFPVDIHADKATYEIQFGNVERPTHWNTSWDYARFEVCAQKWADLSEDDYGISLLNDCKYGHDIKDGVMRLTLIKSAIYPNEEADREMHEFTYSIYPHSGDWKKAGTDRMAYSLNCPLYSTMEEVHPGRLSEEFSAIHADCDNVKIEVVKKAEDSGDLIVRLYEYQNKRTKVSLELFRDVSEVWECDLMETGIEKINHCGARFSFMILPFEIKTFKIKI